MTHAVQVASVLVGKSHKDGLGGAMDPTTGRNASHLQSGSPPWFGQTSVVGGFSSIPISRFGP